MQHNQTIQKNNPNIILRGFDDRKRPGTQNVIYTIFHDSLELLLPGDFDHAVEVDYPFKSSLYYRVELMACCDGLVCLWFRNNSRFCIWNPAARENKVLPKSNIPHIDMVAFGYDCKSNDYKLLAGCNDPKLRADHNDSIFEVCFLESNSWKTFGNIPYRFNINRYGRDSNKPSGVLVNGDLHWLATTQHSYDVNLVSLDISNEIFKEVELPIKRLEIIHPYYHRLGVLKGCLCLVAANSGVHEVWVMEYYGIRESWTERYTVNNKTSINEYIRLMWCLKSGEILFGGISADLYLFSPELYSPEDDNKVIKLKISSLKKLYEQECYFESLVSLKSGT